LRGFARPFLQSLAIGRHRLLQPRWLVLPLPKRLGQGTELRLHSGPMKRNTLYGQSCDQAESVVRELTWRHQINAAAPACDITDGAAVERLVGDVIS
jgi:hypothetical protein